MKAIIDDEFCPYCGRGLNVGHLQMPIQIPLAGVCLFSTIQSPWEEGGKGEGDVMKEKEVDGYGKCLDCLWSEALEGCNVKRDSEICLLNRKEKLE